MSMASFKAIVGLAGVLAITSTTQAALLAYEGFDYPAGLLAAQPSPHGGSGWTNDWTRANISSTLHQDQPVVAASLSYTSGTKTLVTSGGKMAPLSNSASLRQAVVRTFDADGIGGGTTLWLSFLGRQNPASGSTVDETSHSGIALMPATGTMISTTPQIFFGKPSGGMNFGFDTSNPTQANTISSNAGNVDHFFLAKIVMPAAIGGQASISLWIDPNLDGEAFLPGATGTKNFTANYNPGRILMSTNANVTGFQWDEVRLGTSYDDVVVVPEPAITGLAILAAGMLMRRGRRRVA